MTPSGTVHIASQIWTTKIWSGSLVITIWTKLIGLLDSWGLEIEKLVVSGFISATRTPDALARRNSLGFRVNMGRGECSLQAKLFPRKHPKAWTGNPNLNFSEAGSLATAGQRCHHETAWPIVSKLPLPCPRNDKHPPSIRICSDTHIASSFAQ